MKRRTTFGTLLTDFRFKRQQARNKAEADLWDRNKLSSKEFGKQEQLRAGHEIHEKSIHNKDGEQFIELQLWKKIDTIAVKVSSNVKAEQIEVKQGASLEELMDETKK